MLSKVTALAALCMALAVYCRAQAAKPFPEQFASALPEVKAKSRVPVLLPSELSRPIGGAKHAVVETASDNEYAIVLYYELGIGDAGFAATFSGRSDPDYDPRDIANISEVKLSHGLLGYFRPVSCGGSCAPANIWWKDGRVLYSIQLKMSPSVRESIQQRAISAAANSAILAGPR